MLFVAQCRGLIIPLRVRCIADAQCDTLLVALRAGRQRRGVCLQMRRLSKAAHSAEELSDLASQRGDARTALEAQAYALYMAGTLAFERQRWEAALAKLLRAQ